jgi:hypothetical protein
MGLKDDLLNELQKAQKRGDANAVAFFQAQVDRLVKARGDRAAGVQTTFGTIPETYRVQKGDSPASIAAKFYGNERALFDIIAANRDAFTFTDGAYNVNITPGQTLNLPQGAVGGANVPTDVSLREASGRIVNFGTGAAVPVETSTEVPTTPVSPTISAAERATASPQTRVPPPIIPPALQSPQVTRGISPATPTPLTPAPVTQDFGAGQQLAPFKGDPRLAPPQTADPLITPEISRAISRVSAISQGRPALTAQSVAREAGQIQSVAREPSSSFIHQGVAEIAGRLGTGVQAAAINAAIVTGTIPDVIPFAVMERLGMTSTELLQRGFVPDANTGMWVHQDETGGAISGTGGFFRPTFGFQNNGFKRSGRRRGSLSVPRLIAPSFGARAQYSDTPGLISWRIDF